MSLGFEMANFNVVAAVDNWIDALNTLKYNSPKTRTELLDLSDAEPLGKLLETIGPIDLVVGGPPCQGFSIAGKRDPSDFRNMLYEGFVESIRRLRPKAFIMENVPAIASPTNLELFKEIIQDFEGLGFAVSSKVLLASNFGVPQNRRRMFIVGIADKAKSFDFPEGVLSSISASEAISDLPALGQPDGSRYPIGARTPFQEWARVGSPTLFNHQTTNHTAQTVEVISHVPDGGNYKSLPHSLTGIRNVNIAWTRLSSMKPSFTIDTGHRHHFHYEYNRVPTARESARLQSFPDDYIFLGSKTSQLRQVGNAVPPLMAKALAESLRLQIDSQRSEDV